MAKSEEETLRIIRDHHYKEWKQEATDRQIQEAILDELRAIRRSLVLEE